MNKPALFFTTMLLLSCNRHLQQAVTSRYSQIENAAWLSGVWQQQTARGVLYERWMRSSDSSFSGMSYMLRGGDTLVRETISLELRDGELYYIPTVKDQNNAQPVLFRRVASGPDSLVFENPAHDFPTMIKYVRISADSLLAEISGMAGGQLRKREFPMSRVKP
ncbi:DUF6265 family protein [Chitinophaga sp. XS-30]|uniref:DUF6265 family protein n=1 Tax=Chitinophaga sp. XS-30 TaxID=2604421 RepID=UPI0011DE31EC|nr:DUF6265 family protein [Chitinophaga sp. XS-30]QEH42906.1 hypothetical protein FW415_19345 [Chitinophaga sp. XS-30]